MENHRMIQEHPLRHLGRCLTQNSEFLQVVQVAQERKKAGQSHDSEWDLDLSDLFSWLSEDPDSATAASGSATTAAVATGSTATPGELVQEAIEHLRLFRGLWRLLELQQLPRAMEALLQVVQYAGQQRYSLLLLQREVESLLKEAESHLETFGPPPWANVCLQAKTEGAQQQRGHGLSSACSTTSTAGPCSADGALAHFFSQETAGCSSDSDLSGVESGAECFSAEDQGEARDPQDLHAWELQFLCVAAAEDLWRALRCQDLDRALRVVLSLREEILQVPPSPL